MAVDPNNGSAQEDLAAAIHETTNALTVILGWIGRARQATVKDAEAQRCLQRASHYARSARDQMRRSIGAAVPSAHPERLDRLAARVCEDLSVEAHAGQLELKLELGDAVAGAALWLPEPQAAWQVLTNLLLNAIAMSPVDSRVTLEVDATSQARFVVRDDGPGIPPERRENLFSAGHSGRPGGAGIGLRHAHALAAELGGRLALLDSNEGAAFELRWPLQAAAALGADINPTPEELPPVSERAEAVGLEGTKILLLEDDAAVIELLELSLGARGAAVTAVRDADAFHTCLQDNRYDVLLFDISPLGDRLDDAIRDARQHNPDSSLVVISGSVTVQPRDGVVWVRKPFEPRELVTAIVRHRQQASG